MLFIMLSAVPKLTLKIKGIETKVLNVLLDTENCSSKSDDQQMNED